ncbi:MAG TPA: Hsp20/alpha crystallin family protein [Thermoanaerobaculia bacterium]|nr:Hsp20/alpha crystallin family protein [Thermoanaerobaculia bacterium]
MTRWTAQNQEMKSLQTQLNRLFEPFARFSVAADEDLVSGAWVPPVDVAETQDKILVRAEVPGLKQEDIQIEFENGLLTLKGERRLTKNDGMTWHRVERTYGNFSRTFTLPRSVDAEKIAATYREGILEIEVPKREEAKPKQIHIAVTN